MAAVITQMREDAGFGQDGGRGSGGREEAREIKGFSSRCHFLSQEETLRGVFFLQVAAIKNSVFNIRTEKSIRIQRELSRTRERVSALSNVSDKVQPPHSLGSH